MANICVELDAYVLPNDHSVWKCFPGKTYRFYELVQRTDLVFLDIRNLEQLFKEPKKWDDQEALEIIAADRWAREIERNRFGGKPKGSENVSPIDRRNLTFVKGLLFTAKRGDLIALPAEGYRKEVLLGELLDEPGAVFEQTARDGDREYTYIGRRVKWRSGKEKRFFSRDLIDLLHTPAAFFLLPRSTYEEIYRVAYQNFVAGEVFAATFETTKQHFSTSDTAVTGMWFNALAAIREAIEKNDNLAAKTYLDLGLSIASNAKDGELAININSPGEFLLRSIGVFAIVTMAMLPLTDVSAEDLIAGNIKVELKVVGSATDECGLRIDAAIADYAKTLSVLRLQQHCLIGKRAREEATLKTKARLK